VLRLAASLEKASEHPLGAAIVDAAAKRNVKLIEPTDFDSPIGKGVKGRVEGKAILIGNALFLSEEGVDAQALVLEADRLRTDGATAIFVGIDGKAAGIIAIADPIKDSTPATIAALHDQRVKIVMLTGDNKTTAQAVARKLGIDDVEAEVLPDRKSEVVT